MHQELKTLLVDWRQVDVVLPGGEVKTVTVEDVRRFVSKIRVEADGCWTWTAAHSSDGYGFFYFGRQTKAHRFAHLALVGAIPRGMQLDHACHTAAVQAGTCEGGNGCPHRRCVHPAHLLVVTARENTLASLAPTAGNARKTHCVRGHALTPEGVYVRRDGSRACRQCKRDSDDKISIRKAESLGRSKLLPPGERTHCPSGHPYDSENTFLTPAGGRGCRICRRGRDRAYRQRKKGLLP